jgi:glucose-6-phosphate isomerase
MIPEWMGGRYSIWSAVGLSCAIALGFEAFYEMHIGAHEMDQHFYQAPAADNKIIQYASMMYDALLNEQLKTVTILPYAHRLRTLPDYLQQLFMESLGKQITNSGEPAHYPTGPIVFGSAGTNSQHGFQQLMMQGTHPIFADFILPLEQANVVANCVTQVKTLRDGVADIDPLKHISGGKCANLFVLEKLNLKTVGALLAFYEHVVVTLAFLLKINPFDQFGVEHAKRESEQLLKQTGNNITRIEQIEKLFFY